MANIEIDPCMCGWFAVIGDYTGVLTSLLDTSIASLTAVKVALMLVPTNFTDQAKRLRYEVELALIEEAIKAIEVPLGVITNLGRPFADCDAVANVTVVTGKIYDLLIADVADRRFQVESFIEALEAESLQIEELDRLIDFMTEIKSAIEDCGNV